MSETKPKKMVRRSVAIAVGIICIILVTAIYMPMINDKDSKISSQTSQISSLQAQNNQLQTWLDGNKTDYQNYRNSHSHSDYNLLQSIANLGEQQPILNQYTTNQGANAHIYVTGLQANYAGYLHISLTSTTSNAYVIVEYWFQGQLFSFTNTIGTSGEAYFLLMPSNVAIYVGNRNPVNGATDTITATYYY